MTAHEGVMLYVAAIATGIGVSGLYMGIRRLWQRFFGPRDRTAELMDHEAGIVTRREFPGGVRCADPDCGDLLKPGMAYATRQIGEHTDLVICPACAMRDAIAGR
jgi:hypothetical protein